MHWAWHFVGYIIFLELIPNYLLSHADPFLLPTVLLEVLEF